MLPFGYCTNVHAGFRLEEIKSALGTHAAEVKRLVSAGEALRLGLWLGESASVELQDRIKFAAFRDWIGESNFTISTLNGFPAGDFHQPIVKYDVYRPTWADPSRLSYTCRLIDVLIELLGESTHGTISTLPLGWRSDDIDPTFQSRCATNLLACADYARRRHSETGKQVRICLEPEPGCILGTSTQLVEFFERHLLESNENRNLTEEYLGVCHDVCHAAVMWEDQAEVLNRYKSSEIVVGKVQVSAALTALFSRVFRPASQRTTDRLAQFCEPRYLHQTSTATGAGFYDDLPQALKSIPGSGPWRVHFHVPIFATNLGDGLFTTQDTIVECLRELWYKRKEIDWEIETYAWDVLPELLRVESISTGIALEMNWLKSLWEQTAVELGD
jgi:hypothetical protein